MPISCRHIAHALTLLLLSAPSEGPQALPHHQPLGPTPLSVGAGLWLHDVAAGPLTVHALAPEGIWEVDRSGNESRFTPFPPDIDPRSIHGLCSDSRPGIVRLDRRPNPDLLLEPGGRWTRGWPGDTVGCPDDPGEDIPAMGSLSEHGWSRVGGSVQDPNGFRHAVSVVRHGRSGAAWAATWGAGLWHARSPAALWRMVPLGTGVLRPQAVFADNRGWLLLLGADGGLGWRDPEGTWRHLRSSDPRITDLGGLVDGVTDTGGFTLAGPLGWLTIDGDRARARSVRNWLSGIGLLAMARRGDTIALATESGIALFRGPDPILQWIPSGLNPVTGIQPSDSGWWITTSAGCGHLRPPSEVRMMSDPAAGPGCRLMMDVGPFRVGLGIHGPFALDNRNRQIVPPRSGRSVRALVRGPVSTVWGVGPEGLLAWDLESGTSLPYASAGEQPLTHATDLAFGRHDTLWVAGPWGITGLVARDYAPPSAVRHWPR